MSVYLDRYAWPNTEFPDYRPPSDLEMIVVIPAFNERDINKAISSLDRCENNEKVLVIVLINEPEDTDENISITNEQTLQELEGSRFKIPILSKLLKLKPKKAGVGLARKIGMDEAFRIFNHLNKDGIIICFDADCTCNTNYFNEIKKFYSTTSNHLGLVHYEHDLGGENIEAIINYELFLRYYVNALRWASFSFAFQTLGSCITVRSKAYQKQGGMNTRKAGEDFYFIHKMTPLGKIGEINTTTIHPSDRVSERVPFGTGHAIQKYLNQTNENYDTYNPRTFTELKYVFSNIESLFHCSDSTSIGYTKGILHFLEDQEFEPALQKMKSQSPSFKIFKDRFNAWFDAFRVLKYVHFMRDNYYPNIDIVDAIGWINYQYLKIDHFDGSKEKKLLAMRLNDRNANYHIK